MSEEGLRIVAVKVRLEDGSEIEPSCWAVVFLQEGEGDKLLPKWEWSRTNYSTPEIALRGAGIEGLLHEYNEDAAIKGTLIKDEISEAPRDGIVCPDCNSKARYASAGMYSCSNPKCNSFWSVTIDDLTTVEQLREVSRDLLQDLSETRKKSTLYKQYASLLNEAVDILKEMLGILESVDSLSELMEKFEKLKIRVDQHWIRASIALNLVEPAIRRKLANLGASLPATPPYPKFEQLSTLAVEKIREKEGREIKKQLLTPSHYWDMRKQIDHYGLDYSVSKEDADLIVDAVAGYLRELFPPEQKKTN